MTIFLKDDPEYPDLDCGEAAKKYLNLVNSPHYRVEPLPEEYEYYYSTFGKHRKKKLPLLPAIILPANLDSSRRKVPPAVAVKVLEALKICGTVPSEIYVYQLFCKVKKLGYRYDYRNKIWEPK